QVGALEAADNADQAAEVRYAPGLLKA
ncbi:MAG: hypothetical protein AWU57_4382, partial [Marinobacter sp. T13-3]